MKTLVIGDHFIHEDFHIDALRERFGPGFGPIASSALPGTKSDQHRLQHQMEFDGLDAVPVDADIVAAIADSSLVVTHFAPVTAASFDADSRVRAVFVARSGVENVDVAAATARGIGVVNIHGRNASAVAELAIGLMLAEARDIARAHHSVRMGRWQKEFPVPSQELGGSTVGLVGLGHVGREIAARLRGFQVRMLVADPHVGPDVIRSSGGNAVSIEEVFAASDFVSVQARLTPETRHFIDRRLMGLMKPTAYLINVGRSRLLDTEALLEVLEAGRIAGAALDVHDEEPLPHDSPFRALDNVTVTTHFGGDTVQTNIRSAQLVAEAIGEFLSTGQVASAVNAAAIGWTT